MILSQCELVTGPNPAPNVPICLQDAFYLLELDGIPEILGGFDIEYALIANDPDIPSILDRPILGISEGDYQGVLDSCNEGFDPDLLSDATIVPLVFFQSELNSISTNPVAGGVIGATGNESFSEFLVLLPNITAVPVPDPLTLNAITGVLLSPTIAAIIGFTPCILVGEEYAVPFELVDAPSSSFELDSCSLNLQNNSIAPFFIESAFWDFGNGLTSEEYEPSYAVFDAAGDYEVSLVVCYNGTCDTTTQTISIGDELLLEIPEVGMVNEPISFQANSTRYTNWTWVFGDGNVSLEQNPMHTYSAPGTYTIELVLTDNETVNCTAQFFKEIVIEGSDDQTDECTLETGPNPSIDQTICLNDNFYTMDLGEVPEILGDFDVEYAIIAQDPNIPDILDRTILAFSEVGYPGIHDNCNNDIDESLLSGATIVPVVFRQDEIAAILYNPFPTSIIGAQGGESLAEFLLLFPMITTIPIPDTLTLNVITDVLLSPAIEGLTGFAPCIQVDAEDAVPFDLTDAPTASFILDSCSLNLQNTSAAEIFAETTYWDFGNGLSSSAYQPALAAYDVGGEYEVSLVVCNEEVCDTVVQVINVESDLSITIPESGIANQPISFQANSAKHTNWTWVFGDGNLSLEQNPIHTYTTAGTYEVELVLTDSTTVDCTAQFIQEVVITDNVGIGLQRELQIDIFPNPSNGSTSIRLPKDIGDFEWSLHNSSGEEQFRQVVSGSTMLNFDASALHPGVYILTVQSSKHKGSRKLLVF